MGYYGVILSILMLLIALVCHISLAYKSSHLNSRFSTSTSGRRQIDMSYAPQTYTSIKIPSIKTELLVRDGEDEIFATISSWGTGKKKEKEEAVKQWTEQGSAFWMDAEGTRAVHLAEIKRKRPSSTSLKLPAIKPKNKWIAADVYVNCATDDDPVYMHTSKYQSLMQGNDKRLSDTALEALIDSGAAFRNISYMLTSEQVLNRADGIATRLKDDFEMVSPEWRRWTEKTTGYNTTSLTQVVGEYFSQHSIGDVGGPNARYEGKPGYSGTLAPGIHFQDSYPAEELPTKVLHPWPSAQQFQFHVRWPPSHPMIPPPILWFAVNNMYTENYTAAMLQEPSEEIVGGLLMEPKDAVRIAKYGEFGNSYEPSDQIPHGGMIFDSAYRIPGYNPDHGPTVSEEEAKAPIPDELLPITETWLSPYYGLESADPKLKLTDDMERVDAEAEEEHRRQLVEQMISQSKLGHPVEDDENVAGDAKAAEGVSSNKEPLWFVAEQAEEVAIETEIDRRMLLQQEELELQMEELQGEDGSAVAGEEELESIAGGTDDDELKDSRGSKLPPATTYLDYNKNLNTLSISEEPYNVESDLSQRAKFRQEILTAKNLADVAAGKARGKRAIIKYTIESIESMSREVADAEREATNNSRRPKRRKYTMKKKKPKSQRGSEVAVGSAAGAGGDMDDMDMHGSGGGQEGSDSPFEEGSESTYADPEAGFEKMDGGDDLEPF